MGYSLVGGPKPPEPVGDYHQLVLRPVAHLTNKAPSRKCLLLLRIGSCHLMSRECFIVGFPSRMLCGSSSRPRCNNITYSLSFFLSLFPFILSLNNPCSPPLSLSPSRPDSLFRFLAPFLCVAHLRCSLALSFCVTFPPCRSLSLSLYVYASAPSLSMCLFFPCRFVVVTVSRYPGENLHNRICDGKGARCKGNETDCN